MRLILPLYALAAIAPVALGAAVASDSKNAEVARLTRAPSPSLLARHGDDEHEEAVHHEKPTLESSHLHNPTAAAVIAIPSHDDEHSEAEHSHNSHMKPQEYINETQILEHHAPDPMSYFDYDQGVDGERRVLVVHIVFMTLSYFLFLPLAIALKSGGSPLAVLVQVAFLVTSVLGLMFGAIYNHTTPDLYEKSSHTRLGYIVVVVSLVATGLDVLRVGFRFTRWGRRAATPMAQGYSDQAESDPLVGGGRHSKDEEREEEEDDIIVSSPMTITETGEGHHWDSVPLGRQDSAHRRSHSTHSDDTLLDHTHPVRRSSLNVAKSALSSYGTLAINLTEKLLVLFAYVEVISGIAVYSGSCRGAYGNGCWAHLIKGSIFLWYGLLTFARYLGAFSHIGWAWNISPVKSVSAEFVESSVIFVYGITQVWLERLGHSDKPINVKDMQHISIAGMFWFAGLLGMMLESKRVRALLNAPVLAAASQSDSSRVRQPASASFSFNPFPAIVIGVTGLAMSAHAQRYIFQVEVHALWGLLLAGFAGFRLLTYFFLYLRPPHSILSSRPPTEALASLMLACGGLVFMESTEEVTFAAMRYGFDDIMAFLNVTVCLICLVFTWQIILWAVQGWALERSSRLTTDPSNSSRLDDEPKV